MLKDQAKEMFDKYWALEKYLEEQKDTKDLELMIGVIQGSSILITTLVTRISEVTQFANELMEVAKNEKQ